MVINSNGASVSSLQYVVIPTIKTICSDKFILMELFILVMENAIFAPMMTMESPRALPRVPHLSPSAIWKSGVSF